MTAHDRGRDAAIPEIPGSEPLSPDGLRQLHHDLVNPLNVLTGAARALAATPLDDAQRLWVDVLLRAAGRLLDVVAGLERDRAVDDPTVRERVADLASIAAARLSKPFDRDRLLATVQSVVGRSAPRVLLVDDSPELALLVRSYIRGADWDLDVVESGERAVAQATTEHYDVVLMDIDLPGLDGAAAAHAIRAADLARDASPTPIVAMTAFDRHPDLHDTRESVRSSAPAAE